MANKLNCWEFKRCGREPGGEKATSLGVCRASIDRKWHHTNNGKNAGRCCWVVAGTFCQGMVQGTFAQKYHDCAMCDFYDHVKFEEYPAFIKAESLLEKDL